MNKASDINFVYAFLYNNLHGSGIAAGLLTRFPYFSFHYTGNMQIFRGIDDVGL